MKTHLTLSLLISVVFSGWSSVVAQDINDEQTIRDAYVYLLGRALVIRQEQTDMQEEGVDYNVIKYNPVGSADFVNPNLDVAYLEAWIAVDDRTPVMLEVPEVKGRYYTAQILDEWGTYFLAALIGVLVLALNPPAVQADDLTPTEAKALAEEAYICGFAIVENYKAIFGMCVYEKSPQYSGFNHYLHGRKLFDPDYKVVVSANNDTLYSTTFANVRTEPLVVSVPPTDKFDRVIVSRSHFFALATRTAVDSAEDVKNVAVIQDQMKLTPLSEYLGTPTPKPAPRITFPPYNAAKLYGKPELLAYMNTFLEWQYPTLEEAPLMRRLAKINVGPGRNFRLTDFDPEIQLAIKEGTASGHKKVEEKGNSLGERIEGWEYTPPMGDYGTDYLFRSAVAWKFIYTNSPEEALYPIAEADSEGKDLSGKNNYVLHFPAGKLPPVDAFWSMTMYHADSRLMVHNPIERYSIGDRTKGLKYGDDGSLTVYVQHEDPGGEKRSNWLPAPAGDFYIICRMYMPQKPALTGKYRLPPLKNVR